MFVRLQDFFKHQNLVIWINELINKKNTNIDLGNYFISELNNKKIKQQLFFKIHSENDLKNKLECAFRNINEQMDDKLKKVLMGELWINTPLDWGDYK